MNHTLKHSKFGGYDYCARCGQRADDAPAECYWPQNTHPYIPGRTPRTDAAVYHLETFDDSKEGFVHPEFARCLENDLNEMGQALMLLVEQYCPANNRHSFECDSRAKDVLLRWIKANPAAPSNH